MTPIPVIVGATQCTQFPDTETPMDPMGLMTKTGTMALEDAGPPGLRNCVDCVWVSNILSWGYKDAPGMLSRNLDLKPSHTHYATMSGHTPQWFVNQAARRIASGESRVVLMAGAESQYTVKQSYKGQAKTDWPIRENPEIVGDGTSPDLGTNSLENSHQLMIPVNMYALFETAIRAASRKSPDDHQIVLGNLFEKFSRVAANNPFAWNRTACSAREISLPGPYNPVACHPYTRRMCANMNVDMSAALVMTSEEIARDLGIDPSKWVYPMGGADLNNIMYVTQRPRLDNSPALEHCVRLALEQAGLDLSQIQAFDLYSCFPSMVEMALSSLNLRADDPRPFTVTGGLPFFGGPMGNYSMHAIATVVDKIRAGSVDSAMITANGGFNTRHSVGIYGAKPSGAGWPPRDDSPIQEEILSATLPEPESKANGDMRVEGYIVRNNRDGEPEKGLVLGSLENGRKTLARLVAEPALLRHFCNNELVGGLGRVHYDPVAQSNMFVPEF
ncbi:MAG: acetyl-CoA acetyltransferase [Desulfatibacillum sp.]|nr:acetyl-CoA acetyltransferase [Desulfatibacillum sp.]